MLPSMGLITIVLVRNIDLKVHNFFTMSLTVMPVESTFVKQDLLTTKAFHTVLEHFGKDKLALCSLSLLTPMFE